MPLPDLHLVLSDWFDEDPGSEFGDMGYHTFHFAEEQFSNRGLCGEEGTPYEYYSSMLNPTDPYLCSSCVRVAHTAIRNLIDRGEL